MRKLRKVNQELAFCLNRIAQKKRVLRDKRGRLARAKADLAAGERRQAIGTVVAQLARHAKRLKLAVAIESLDA